MEKSLDSFGAIRSFHAGGRRFRYYSLAAAGEASGEPVMRLPRSLKVLYENLLRHEDGYSVTIEDLRGFCRALQGEEREIAFYPTRIMMNDSSGIPLMADLAALRAAMARNGGDPRSINPTIPADLIVDHSVMVDVHGSADAVEANLDKEYERNDGRYRFLRWAQQSFENFRVVPPGVGIAHQVNIEALARGVWVEGEAGDQLASPETLLGTDSHTPMINSLGVLGWGVGGVEAGSALLGQPVTMMVPRVVGCRFEGCLNPGVTATDLVLAIVERLRDYGVIGCFVEYFGPGLPSLTLSDRATLANMAPEYGATMGYFPVDGETLTYLRQTARGDSHVSLVEAHARLQGLWHDPDGPQPVFAEEIEFDLSKVGASVAGPKRPQDRIDLPDVPEAFDNDVLPECAPLNGDRVQVDGVDWTLGHGDVIIASITSCTNTANPSVMLAAGLLAQKAFRRGLAVKPWVKTSLSPGSRVVADYLSEMGLQESLDALGFNLTGFGCMTCMGNSGPLAPAVARAIQDNDLTASAVLSGNRNFEGRIHTLARTNYICSPPLVVAYAVAGSMRVNLTEEPLGTDPDGDPVYLADIWPTPGEIEALARRVLTPDRYENRYAAMFDGDARWKALPTPASELFPWPEDSYMKEPPFFRNVEPAMPQAGDIMNARALALLGDSVTTDHISPVGEITPDSSAGRYLVENGVEPVDFNSFAARRVNHEVMLRGAFANIRLRNEMAPEKRGGWTRHEPGGEIMPVHEAAALYDREGVPLVVFAGHDYGQGSSRDWAAKGTRLLGVRAVIARSFERIHRSNLVGLGVLPLQLPDGDSWQSLGIDGTERFDLSGISGDMAPKSRVELRITRSSGETRTVPLLCRLDTRLEAEYWRNGGTLHYILRKSLARPE